MTYKTNYKGLKKRRMANSTEKELSDKLEIERLEKKLGYHQWSDEKEKMSVGATNGRVDAGKADMEQKKIFEDFKKGILTEKEALEMLVVYE